MTGQLGHRYADELYGIHLGSGQRLDLFSGDRAWDVTRGVPLPQEPQMRSRAIELERRFAVHLVAHTLAPSTLAPALTDSPAGMLAWLLERWSAWSDDDGDVFTVFSRDELLTHATIYWATNSIGSSMRTYANNNRYPWAPAHSRSPVIEAPAGLTLVGYEDPPGVATPQERIAAYLSSDRADWYRLINVRAHRRGGHFIPSEVPGAWIDDLRLTFRELRRTE